MVKASCCCIVRAFFSRYAERVARHGFDVLFRRVGPKRQPDPGSAPIYTLAAALTQPLFGILADRWHGRYLGALGLLWTMTFFALSPFMPSYPALVACLTVGALGSGALHPAGLLNASTAGGRRPTTAASIFFVSGQTGLALGPVLAGVIIQTIGLKAGLPLMALAVLPASSS